MFAGSGPKDLKKVRKNLKAELRDKDLPRQRKEEIESYLYYIGECIRAKRGKSFKRLNKNEIRGQEKPFRLRS